MIVTCSECDTSFNFDEQFIKETGSKVRCSKCKSVFVVYPPTVSDLHAAAAHSHDASPAPEAPSAGLDEVDLSEIENLLDSDQRAPEAETSAELGDAGDFELDLDLEDVGITADSEPQTDLDETNELDLSDMDLDESVGSAQPSTESGEDLDFQLDLTPETESIQEDTVQGDQAVPADSAEEFDFELDLDAADSADDGDSTENLDLELDFGDFAGPDESAFQSDMEETQDLDLSEMEGIAPDDAEDQAGSEDSDSGGDDSDLELDFTEYAQTPAAPQKPAGSDETEELDLSELEDMLEGEEPMSDQAMDTQASDGLDFELDLDDIEQAPPSQDSPGPVMDETVALDVSDLEDLGNITADTPEATVEQGIDESTDDLDLELDLELESSDSQEVSSDIEDSFDLNELDEMLDTPESSVVDEGALESTDDFDLELDLSDNDAGPEAADLVSTEESDLSDLEGMLDLDEEPIAEELASDVEELELDDVSIEPAAPEEPSFEQTENLQNVELAFDDEEEADSGEDFEGMDAIESEQEEEEVADTFDMGTLTAGEQTKKEAQPMAQMDIPEDMDDEMPPPKRRLSAPLRLLLVLVLIVGGGIGTLTLLDFMGLGINMKEIGSNIPVVGDLFGPKYTDKGNLKIAIIEKMVKYDIVENSAGGTLLVIEGKIRNSYDHPRSFIRVTGKLYDRKKKLAGQKTVYAGNLIPNRDLAKLNSAAIDKKLNNRFGARRANVKVKKGRMVPFMIVFSSLPQDLDEFTVEVAGSTKTSG